MTTRTPAVLMAIGVAATLVLALAVVIALLQTGGANAVSDNAALIGALVALGGVFTAQMVSIALDDRRTRESRTIEALRAQEARSIEAQRANEAALQNYVEQVGKLLIEQPVHRARPGDSLSTLVRAQTLAVLQGLDPARKGISVLFLYESGLINKDKSVVSLLFANLTYANLKHTSLIEINLSLTNLSQADLSEAWLDRADLRGATLYQADLRETDLSEANLSEANLNGADLSGADLSRADLSRARNVTHEQLAKCESLEGATMPNGQKYEDWQKSLASAPEESRRGFWPRLFGG